MRIKRADKGFSLVELMVALGILALGMAAVGVMLLSSFQADRYNRNVRRAEMILRYFAERFAAGNVVEGSTSTALDASGTAVIRGNEIVTDTADTDPGTFYCNWTSTAYSSTTSGIYQLDVVVGWGKSKSSSYPCDRDHPDQCPHVMRMTNFY